MTKPDLNSDEGRAAYRKELRGVARPLRAGGLALVVGAAIIIMIARQPENAAWEQVAVYISYGMLALGWVAVVSAIFLRTRHHRNRMRALDGDSE